MGTMWCLYDPIPSGWCKRMLIPWTLVQGSKSISYRVSKTCKAISLPQDVPSTSDCRRIELENRVQRLMEAHLAPNSSVQVNKLASVCKICSGLHDTQYCMENPEKAFVDYASSCTDKVNGK
ncbi:hypothetical protein Tco_0374541 [Tanacetum coccineum]